MVFGRESSNSENYSGDASSLDRRQLDNVCSGNEDLRRRILAEFVRISPSQMALLVESLESEETTEAKLLAHGLMGSSRAIGAIALGNLCEEVCHGPSAGSPMSVSERLRTEFEQVMVAIESQIGSR